MLAPLRICFEYAERGADHVFGPSCNPITQLGAIGFLLFWIVSASGIYLFVFFDTSVTGAYASVESITTAQWFAGGVMRSLHRYASDLMVVTLVLHATREFALGHFRGARWYSWISGIPVIGFLYASGITGYWLVWDKLAQYIAVATTELLDWLPLFGGTIARNFLTPESLGDRFFTLLVFLHIVIPLMLLFAMWLHILRISRPKVNPPRTLAIVTLVSLIGVSLWKPALSQGPADLSQVANDIGIDWYYLAALPLADHISYGAVWAMLGGFALMLAAIPWLPPFRRPKPAEVSLDNCNGCGRCVDDCPYEALRLVPRTDGSAFEQEVEVTTDRCVGCGICAGACPSSTPFRRRTSLVTGIDLPDLPLQELKRQTDAAGDILTDSPRILVFGCEHGAASGVAQNVVRLRCVAMLPPSFIDYVISRRLADGVVIAGCAERACYHRLGMVWTTQRLQGQRDPSLRERVPRERLTTIWASRTEQRRFSDELERFREAVAALPPEPPRRLGDLSTLSAEPAPVRETSG